MFKKELAQLRRLYRDNRYLSFVADMAEETGVSRQTVHNWIIGKKSPRKKRRQAIREYLKKITPKP